MVAGPAILPFRQYVLKLHSRCDLACDHCYIYEHADQSWRGRPLALSEETAARVVDRIAEHCLEHALRRITVVLHGGEPLLFGVERTRGLLELFRARLPVGIGTDLRIHTNAVRLDTAYLDLFLEFGVKVGVSLDGDRAANDLHRRFASGRTSHPNVLRGLALLRQPSYRNLYAGILCTIDIRNDPIRVYEALAAQEPPRADLLLPHATWDNPPPRAQFGNGGGGGSGDVPEYAAWLGAVYDRWTRDGRPFAIRTFDSIGAVLRGLPSQTEALGLAPADLVVIETDGSLEQADSLKTSFEGAAATGFNVFEHSLDEAAAHPGMAARQGGLETLCATCRACPVVEVCGGGLYAHRYRTGTGFDNPSVYCEDLEALIQHVRDDETRREAAATAAASPHSLSMADFDMLASGYGDAEVIGRLSNTQMSISRALVMEIGNAVAPGSPFADAWQEIVRLDAASPAAVGAVFGDPYTRVWAVRLLSREPDVSPAPADLARLAEIAASAALLACDEVRLPLHLVGGVVQLPTLGALALGGPERPASIETRKDGTATIAADGREYEICVRDPASGAALEWLPQRRLAAGSWSVAVQDTDPYRDCYQSPAAPRLSTTGIEVWRGRFAEAVRFLEDLLPGYLPGLRAGLSTLMPMAAPSGAHEVSGTARQAYGAVGLALPADGPTLALLVIHEFQHVKLGAVLDSYDFYDPADDRLHYAPWRPDPRPLEGLYQGAYAHLAVTEYWRVRRHVVSGPWQEAAEAHFARWRTHTADAVKVLLESGSLTPLGERFARAMGETVAPWLEEPVRRSAVIAAQRAADSHRAAWESRRLRQPAAD
jgi:uncharacterized protein